MKTELHLAKLIDLVRSSWMLLLISPLRISFSPKTT